MNVIAQLFLYVVGFALFLVGAFAIVSIKSDIQLIAAVLAFGLGALVFAAAWVMEDLRMIRQKL